MHAPFPGEVQSGAQLGYLYKHINGLEGQRWPAFRRANVTLSIYVASRRGRAPFTAHQRYRYIKAELRLRLRQSDRVHLRPGTSSNFAAGTFNAVAIS